ncbi:MAG: hypothetical protein ACLFRG_19180 [Desulfococcaceae bacterium]
MPESHSRLETGLVQAGAPPTGHRRRGLPVGRRFGPAGSVIRRLASLATIFAATTALATPLQHDFRVRNFTGERLEIRIGPHGVWTDGPTRFFVSERACGESSLVFADQCGYEICGVGARTGFSYGCVDISGCAPAGIDFEADRRPIVDGVAVCDGCPHLPCPDDPDDKEVFVSCFIDAAQSVFSNAATSK